jgi:hypothetical protein
MDWQAIIMTKYYNIIRVVPRWALYILTGLIGSFVMNLVHRGKGQTPKAKPAPVAIAAKPTVSGTSTGVAPPATSATPTKGTPTKGKRKGGKK